MSVKDEVAKLRIVGTKLWTKLGSSPERGAEASRREYKIICQIKWDKTDTVQARHKKTKHGLDHEMTTSYDTVEWHWPELESWSTTYCTVTD